MWQPVEGSARHCWRAELRHHIVRTASLLEILVSGLVLIGLLFSSVPLIKWMPGLLSYGNDVEIRAFLERALDIVIGIEFIKMLSKHSPGSSLEVLLYAIARHMVVGHESALESLLSVCSIAAIFIVRKFFFVPSFGSHLPSGEPAPDLDAKAERPSPAAKLREALRLNDAESDEAEDDDADEEEEAEEEELKL